MMRPHHLLAAFGVAVSSLCLSCAGPSGTHAMPDAGMVPTPATDASTPASAMDAGTSVKTMPDATPPFTPIDDSGTALLPDGALIYVWFSARPCPSDDTLTYDNFGAAFFASYCQRCHSARKQGSERNDAPVNLNFDDLPSIRGVAPTIWSVAGDSNTYMPAAPPRPSTEERAKLGAWLACGAPAGSGDLNDAGTP